MGRLLGEGGFGSVYKAKWKKMVVTAKVCRGNLLKGYLEKLKFSLPFHPVPMCSHFLVQLSALLAPNGSLFDYLHQRKDVPSPDQSLAWAQQIASGMQHLHNNNVVHHDLKSGNVLLGLGLVAKVCDFGTARTMAKTAKTS